MTVSTESESLEHVRRDARPRDDSPSFCRVRVRVASYSPFMAPALSWGPITVTEVASTIMLTMILAMAFLVLEVNSRVMAQNEPVNGSSGMLDAAVAPLPMNGNGPDVELASSSSSMLAPVVNVFQRSVMVCWAHHNEPMKRRAELTQRAFVVVIGVGVVQNMSPYFGSQRLSTQQRHTCDGGAHPVLTGRRPVHDSCRCGAADKPSVQLPRWEIHPTEISIQSVLGRGASGQVYLARLRVRCGRRFGARN